MHKQPALILFCVSALLAFGQTSSSKYQHGTITAVTARKNEPGDAREDVAGYDVSVKIGTFFM